MIGIHADTLPDLELSFVPIGETIGMKKASKRDIKKASKLMPEVFWHNQRRYLVNGQLIVKRRK